MLRCRYIGSLYVLASRVQTSPPKPRLVDPNPHSQQLSLLRRSYKNQRHCVLAPRCHRPNCPHLLLQLRVCLGSPYPKTVEFVDNNGASSLPHGGKRRGSRLLCRGTGTVSPSETVQTRYPVRFLRHKRHDPNTGRIHSGVVG